MTTIAAGLPLSQAGRKMLAGWLKELEIREGYAEPEQLAVCAAANRTSRTASCLWIQSLLPPHLAKANMTFTVMQVKAQKK